ERLDIQKHEVRAFLWGNHFRAAAEPLSPFREHLSDVMSYHTRPIIGANAATWITAIDPTEIAEAKRLTVQSLTILQAASGQQKRRIEPEPSRAWVYPKTPARDPAGALMSKAQKDKLAALCYASR